ncbi:MAG: ABC transporter ATP-binding protein, partial [Notoacmeibacter sp.]
RLPQFGNVRVPLKLNGALPVGGAMKLGLRPEHFDANGSVKIDLKIDVVEHLGGTSFGYGGASTEDPITVEIKDGRRVASGAMLKTGFDPEKAFLFDASTGKRLR